MKIFYDNDVFHESYVGMRKETRNANDYIERPCLIRLLPDVKGKKVLDLGCGMGGYIVDLLANAESVDAAVLKNIKPQRISGKAVKWKKAWGAAGVMEKRLISRHNDLPFGLTLKKFAKKKVLVSKKGYKVHSHPTLEIGYILKGKVKIYFEGVGLREFKEGDVVVQPPGLKHAAVSTDRETVIPALNIPPADWEE